MVRHITILILLVFLFSPLSGQQLPSRSEGSLRHNADHYFDRQAYSHAAKLYTKIIIEHPKDREVQFRLADCYRLMREPHRAAQWYGIALHENQAPVEHMFNYASVLCAIEKYQEAKIWFSKYLDSNPKDQRAIAAVKSLKDPRLLYDSLFEVEQMPIDLPGAVFSPVIFNEGLVFVGEGNTGSLLKKVTTWIEGPYFDLYYVPIYDGEPGFPKYFDDKLNSVFHEGPVTFFDGGKKVIFTRSAFRKGDNNTRNLQLMVAEQKPSGSWSSPRKLFHNRNYSVGHPAVNPDGTIIYFSSNKPGGYGGSDLYRSEFKNGRWTEPVNAGPGINTSGNELFPSLGVDGTLYFSSDGQGGLGGLEIFRLVPEQSDKPINMGFPINSAGDDFGLIWEDNASNGYFSTDRTGQDRIYRFEMKAQLVNAAVPVN